MKHRSPHEEFKDHQIARIDERSLYLENHVCGWNSLWCTIAIDDHGQIVVFGDFGPMVFGICRGSLEERIAWMGSHEEAYSYVIGKANIGMGNFRRAMTEVTAEDFEADAREAFGYRREELCEDHEDYEGDMEALTWESFEEKLGYDEKEMLEWTAIPAQRALESYMLDLGHHDSWEWIGGLGERPIREVALAHAALRRAHLLLKAQREYVERCAKDS